MDWIDIVENYHCETVHARGRYARSAGYMDWETQPNPFRFYLGAEMFRLPLLKKLPELSSGDLFVQNRQTPELFTKESIAGFLELSMGLAAWKKSGPNSWALRINPSSGNLHPTEVTIATGSVGDLPGGIYHYSPYFHGLEQRSVIGDSEWGKWQAELGSEGFVAALSTIPWRESWKYGERAFRYCMLDSGHALAALRFAANLYGWHITLLTDHTTDEVEKFLQIDRTTYPAHEPEIAEILMVITPNHSELKRFSPEIVSQWSANPVQGTPNLLSSGHHPWPIIDSVAEASRQIAPEIHTHHPKTVTVATFTNDQSSAVDIIRQRRSAQEYAQRKPISQDAFFAIISATYAHSTSIPFDFSANEPLANLLIFVHAVESLESGLYWYMRSDHTKEEIAMTTRAEFLWEPVEGIEHLYLLQTGDMRGLAETVSCDQTIAGESAFSLGMIVHFKDAIVTAPQRYRTLFHECGMIGQVLYLAAERANLRGTGIGCFHDGSVQKILGVTDNALCSLYHFTVGTPVEDARITTLAPYHHIAEPV